jgi:hypothetical protein
VLPCSPAANVLGWLRDGALLAGDDAHLAAYTRWAVERRQDAAAAAEEGKQEPASEAAADAPSRVSLFGGPERRKRTRVAVPADTPHFLRQAVLLRSGRLFYHPLPLSLSLRALDTASVEASLMHLLRELLRLCKQLGPDGDIDFVDAASARFPADLRIRPPPLSDLIHGWTAPLPDRCAPSAGRRWTGCLTVGLGQAAVAAARQAARPVPQSRIAAGRASHWFCCRCFLWC